MNKQTRQWIAYMKRWIKTQESSIESCELVIKQSNEKIAHLVKRKALERAEIKATRASIKTALLEIKKVSK